MNNYTALQFSVFRIILGVYLVIHFAMLIPYGMEIWSNAGILPDPSLNLTHGIFPNILVAFDSLLQIQFFIWSLLILSFLFAAGFQRPLVALLLWYGWACLFNRNNLISNPGIPFIGWLLLACVLIPRGEPYAFAKENKEWKLPPVLLYGAWIIMSLSYSLSGIDKLQSPNWANGSAIAYLLENPLARNWWLRELMLGLPSILLQLITWIILAIEIIFLPLAIFNKTRKYAWLLMVLVHLGILLLVDFADLTCGMLMIHVFTFDTKWVERSQPPRAV